MFRRTLLPYCRGKKHLLDGINDLWKGCVPTPNYHRHGVVKIVLPTTILQFVELAQTENG